jgi:hypothetical protein
MKTALEYSTRVIQEGGRRCKKSTLNDLVHLTPLRIPLMNPPYASTGRHDCHLADRGGIINIGTPSRDKLGAWSRSDDFFVI